MAMSAFTLVLVTGRRPGGQATSKFREQAGTEWAEAPRSLLCLFHTLGPNSLLL